MSDAPRLFSRHRKIAYGIARDYYLPGGDRDDVNQEALIALWEAARAHDPARGTFPAFARLVIHRRLADAVKAATRQKHTMLTAADRDPETIAVEHNSIDLLTVRERLRLLSQRERDAVRAHLDGTIDPYNRSQESALARARRKLNA